MNETRVQLNARVSKKLRDKVRDDAHRNRTTNDNVVAAIVEDFFKSWTLTERAAFYRKFQGEGGK